MAVKVRQRKDRPGEWWLFVSHRGQRFTKLVGRDKREAEAVARELEKRLAAEALGIAPPLTRNLPTLTDYIKTALARLSLKLRASSVENYTLTLAKHVTPVLGTRRLDAIARRDIKQLAFDLRRTLKPGTVRKVICALSVILAEAVDDELIRENPARDLRAVFRSAEFTPAPDEVAQHFLTGDELGRLLAEARKRPLRYYAFILTLARTGMRLGEAAALQAGDLDFERGIIHVRRTFTNGKVADRPKGGRARCVYMSTQLRETLREVLRAQPVVALDEEARARAWIFPNLSGTGPLCTEWFRRTTFREVIKAAKLRHVRIHDLRHTYASLLLAAGKELHFVQEQLGHASPTVTLHVYGHLLPRDRRGEVDCLDDAIAPSGAQKAP